MYAAAKEESNMKPRIETITIWRNGKRGKTVQLTPSKPMFVYITESAESYDKLSAGLSEDEAAAAALDRRIRYLINTAFGYIVQLCDMDEEKAYTLIDDMAESLQISEDGETVKLFNI